MSVTTILICVLYLLGLSSFAFGNHAGRVNNFKEMSVIAQVVLCATWPLWSLIGLIWAACKNENPMT